MTDDAHDVGLVPLLIDGVAHGLAVNGETFVLITIEFIAALQGAVEVHRIDTDKDIADDVLARDDVATVFVAAAEVLPGLGAKALGSVRDSPVSTHPTGGCPGCDGQNRGKWMTSTLSTAGIGDIRKNSGKGLICSAFSMILGPPVQ